MLTWSKTQTVFQKCASATVQSNVPQKDADPRKYRRGYRGSTQPVWKEVLVFCQRSTYSIILVLGILVIIELYNNSEKSFMDLAEERRRDAVMGVSRLQKLRGEYRNRIRRHEPRKQKSESWDHPMEIKVEESPNNDHNAKDYKDGFYKPDGYNKDEKRRQEEALQEEVVPPNMNEMNTKMVDATPVKTIECRDGSIALLNDNYCDCMDDGRDEPLTPACSNVVVQKPMFYCNDGTDRKIFSSRVGDGIRDCNNGSDEYDLNK
eukprot:CAMPEP_0195527702 /NCGR_PEP_ID=MMETSP0794_2-20130614/29573_1 /TAXON_ID=515487 /ORGANISM="Stephanopyxis turris, Strain CCMP 815" /LENGTH=262 /DNA_ID=CAMNT_0040658679 /DNA_START=128 /DNA_END=917 /DNA_ORIENTATION=-